jgi:hypothetical protein
VEATEPLSLIAELGLGFAGFLAVFLIFARREGRFSPADSVRVRAIIQSSFITIFMALLPLLATLSELETVALWRLSSLVHLAVSAVGGVVVGRRQLALAPGDRVEVGLLNNLVAWGLTLLHFLLLSGNAIGMFGDPSALPYLAALVCMLGVATSNFITIAVHKLL